MRAHNFKRKQVYIWEGLDGGMLIYKFRTVYKSVDRIGPGHTPIEQVLAPIGQFIFTCGTSQHNTVHPRCKSPVQNHPVIPQLYAQRIHIGNGLSFIGVVVRRDNNRVIPCRIPVQIFRIPLISIFLAARRIAEIINLAAHNLL